MSDMDRVRAVLDELAAITEPPCDPGITYGAMETAIDRISRIAYPEAEQ